MATTAAELQAVAQTIRDHDKFLVVAHENPDGDALGSMLGLTLALRELGKDAVMYLAGRAPLPAEYKFLALDELRRDVPPDIGQRVLLAVDCANERRISEERSAVEGAAIWTCS